jgi:hypothetical protein
MSSRSTSLVSSTRSGARSIARATTIALSALAIGASLFGLADERLANALPNCNQVPLPLGCGGGEPLPVTTQTGSAPIKYMVLSVLYSPPGSSTGGGKSMADYGSSSATGVSTSSTSSFKQTYGVKASAGAGLVSASVGFSAGLETSTSDQVSVTKTSSMDIKVAGPNTDGIDHNQDLIYLWLNPMVNVSVTGNNIAWSLSDNTTLGANMVIQYVYVGWLKNPASMPLGVSAALAAAGITSADYPTILARDPFANGSTAIDPARFRLTNTTFPYEPPFTAGAMVPAQTYTVGNDLTDKSSTTSTDSYTLSIAASGGYNLGVVKATLDISASWTWTNTTSYGLSTESKQSSSVTIAGPSPSYKGATNIDVYYDTIYNSFLYAFQPLSTLSTRNVEASVSGTVAGATPNQAVVLTIGGQTFRTYTNAKGAYFFYKTPAGTGTLTTGGVSRAIVSGVKPLQPAML